MHRYEFDTPAFQVSCAGEKIYMGIVLPPLHVQVSAMLVGLAVALSQLFKRVSGK